MGAAAYGRMLPMPLLKHLSSVPGGSGMLASEGRPCMPGYQPGLQPSASGIRRSSTGRMPTATHGDTPRDLQAVKPALIISKHVLTAKLGAS